MLDKVTATRFIKPMGNGRTTPILLECERDDGSLVEVVAKCSAGPMQGVKNLAIEAIAAMLAADLNLPVPEPFVVEILDQLSDMVDLLDIKTLMKGSCPLAFGSKRLPGGFAVWPTGSKVAASSCTEAAEIFVFDTIIVNSDRRPSNPNILFSGDLVAIFDHELTFAQQQILFWRAPWMDDGFDQLNTRDNHIFAKPYLEVCPASLQRFIDAWNALPQGRFSDYVAALPGEWQTDQVFLNFVVNYLGEVQSKIDVIVDSALRALR